MQGDLHGSSSRSSRLMSDHGERSTGAATVAEEVRSFYERMPYPAPLTSLDEHRDLYKDPDRRRVHYLLMWPTEPLRGTPEILVAGCGTSQAARYALREPDARITAIDISETSLRHTRERVVGVGERQGPGRGLQRAGHVLATDEQPAQHELREDEGRHELHRLELGPREGAEQ